MGARERGGGGSVDATTVPDLFGRNGHLKTGLVSFGVIVTLDRMGERPGGTGARVHGGGGSEAFGWRVIRGAGDEG